MSTPPPFDHNPLGDHFDHVELARLHTEGWFLGEAVRTGHPFGALRLQAFLDGFNAGHVPRGETDDH